MKLNWRDFTSIISTLFLLTIGLFVWKGNIDARLCALEDFRQSINEMPIIMSEIKVTTNDMLGIVRQLSSDLKTVSNKTNELQNYHSTLYERVNNIKIRVDRISIKVDEMKERIDKSNINGSRGN